MRARGGTIMGRVVDTVGGRCSARPERPTNPVRRPIPSPPPVGRCAVRGAEETGGGGEKTKKIRAVRDVVKNKTF